MLTIRRERAVVAAFAAAAIMAISAPHAKAGFSLGDAANFGVLYEGGTTFSASSANIIGNVGIGGGAMQTSNTTIDGNVDFAAANSDQAQFSTTNITGTVKYSQSNVSADILSLHDLSVSLGTAGGTVLDNINLNGSNANYTINASQGILDLHGNQVFWIDASSFTFNNGNTITINGDAAGNSVVFNITGGDITFGGGIVLNGLSADQVLFNVADGSNLAVSTDQAMMQGIFLDPAGTMSLENSVLNGRFYGSGGGAMHISSSTLIDPLPGSVPEPSSVSLFGCGLLGLLAMARVRRAARVTA